MAALAKVPGGNGKRKVKAPYPYDSLKLNPKLTRQICNEIRKGNYPAPAAKRHGISESTYHNWMAKGRQGHPIYAPFAEAVELAIAESEVTRVKRWEEAGKKDWRADRDFLARRFPERWAEVRQSNEAGPQIGIQVNITGTDDDKRLAARQVIEAIRTRCVSPLALPAAEVEVGEE